jgi:hypothetical protein
VPPIIFVISIYIVYRSSSFKTFAMRRILVKLRGLPDRIEIEGLAKDLFEFDSRAVSDRSILPSRSENLRAPSSLLQVFLHTLSMPWGACHLQNAVLATVAADNGPSWSSSKPTTVDR